MSFGTDPLVSAAREWLALFPFATPRNAAHDDRVQYTAPLRIRARASRWHLLVSASATAAGIICAACDSVSARDRWLGTVYPDGCCPPPSVRDIGEFASLEECRVACVTYLRDVRSLDEDQSTDEGEESPGDYECGLNCRDADQDHGPGWPEVRICKETSR